MFISFNKEDNVLNEKPFLGDEVQFNIFHKIIEGKEVLSLKTESGNAIAMHNPGYEMWVWVNKEIEANEFGDIIKELCSILDDNDISGISGNPDVVKKIADAYLNHFNVSYKEYMEMNAYECNRVVSLDNTKGKMIKAELKHKDIVAEYCHGFKKSMNGDDMEKEVQLCEAEKLINSGNLYLWEVEDKVVSMANIAHKSQRHCRINNVYTKIEERKKGYGTSLVANVSLKLLEEGITPMLYSEVENIAANKIYRNIGYEHCGKINTIMFIY
ncbi:MULTISPECIES: GNAT family N-acetyltransferase [Clostridium]|uniref:GNAT family N-acetyltransferase n=1 Tax=Clostridium senegalense TaxID=1465809 RepID=A0A6M0H4Z9_9CLOT|nr:MULTISPECIES: GNAT family N-acetyltransferase [Clostridium]NEU05398.1 GNAT family N-acetyltransferase [Clostridium senegalense]